MESSYEATNTRPTLHGTGHGAALGFQTVWFGVLPIPDLLPKNPELGEGLKTVHLGLNFLMAALVAGHAAAAVKHHVADRNDVLRRMLPERGAATRLNLLKEIP
jgi:cytochrome b561